MYALNNIFHDYALVKALRNLIFGKYKQMTARNAIRYMNLNFLVIIKGTYISIELTYSMIMH